MMPLHARDASDTRSPERSMEQTGAWLCQHLDFGRLASRAQGMSFLVLLGAAVPSHHSLVV